jgi:hypothetical protein
VLDYSYLPAGIKDPLIWKYELDQRTYSPENDPTPEMVEDPPGDQSFAYLDLCLETMDVAVTEFRIRRGAGLVCPASGIDQRYIPPGDYTEYKRTRSMRAAAPLDLDFPRLELRPETAAPGKAHAPENKGLNAEVYNPEYFDNLCRWVPSPRDCFEPVYGLDCIYTEEPTYMQPVGFWTLTHADVTADVPGAIPARSIVFGFQPVLFDTTATRGAIEHVLFDEWKLPRK